LLEHANPHLIRLVVQRMSDEFIRHIEAPWYVRLLDGRSSAEFADSDIDVKSLGYFSEDLDDGDDSEYK
jgi:hypothetical protein